jgi:hypothetical protein
MAGLAGGGRYCPLRDPEGDEQGESAPPQRHRDEGQPHGLRGIRNAEGVRE